MGIIKILIKIGNSQFFYIKNNKKMNPIFCMKKNQNKNFGNSRVFYTLATKKCLNVWEFPMKNVDNIFWIPMSSFGGVHLISGVVQLIIGWGLNLQLSDY